MICIVNVIGTFGSYRTICSTGSFRSKIVCASGRSRNICSTGSYQLCKPVCRDTCYTTTCKRRCDDGC